MLFWAQLSLSSPARRRRSHPTSIISLNYLFSVCLTLTTTSIMQIYFCLLFSFFLFLCSLGVLRDNSWCSFWSTLPGWSCSTPSCPRRASARVKLDRSSCRQDVYSISDDGTTDARSAEVKRMFCALASTPR